MIRFDGKHINEISSRLEVLDWTITLPVESVRKQIPGRQGSAFVRNESQDRIITVFIQAIIHNAAEREKVRNALAKWLRKSEPKVLELGTIRNKHIIAECTEFPQFYQSGSALNEEKIVFTAEPFFVSNAEKTTSIGNRFEVQGDTAPKIKIESIIVDEVTDPYWQIDEGQIVMVPGTFENTTFLIDINGRTAYQNGSPVPVSPTTRMEYFEVEPGIHKITGTGGGIVKWQERWL